jgi:hypothetical protein
MAKKKHTLRSPLARDLPLPLLAVAAVAVGSLGAAPLGKLLDTRLCTIPAQIVESVYLPAWYGFCSHDTCQEAGRSCLPFRGVQTDVGAEACGNRRCDEGEYFTCPADCAAPSLTTLGGRRSDLFVPAPLPEVSAPEASSTTPSEGELEDLPLLPADVPQVTAEPEVSEEPVPVIVDEAEASSSSQASSAPYKSRLPAVRAYIQRLLEIRNAQRMPPAPADQAWSTNVSDE